MGGFFIEGFAGGEAVGERSIRKRAAGGFAGEALEEGIQRGAEIDADRLFVQEGGRGGREDGAAAEGQHGRAFRVLRHGFPQDLGFQLPESRFPVLGEDIGDALPRLLHDQVVQVHKGTAEKVREDLPDCRLSASHEACEGNHHSRMDLRAAVTVTSTGR